MNHKKGLRYRYNVGDVPWTGAFKTIEAAKKFYKEHGDFHERNGKKLVLVAVNKKDKTKGE